MTDGIKLMTHAEYAAIDAVNWSCLKDMRRSPLHFQYRRANPPAETAAMRMGRAVHMAVLEPERFARTYVVFPGKMRRGKEWDSFEAEQTAAGHEILKWDETAECDAISQAVRRHPGAMRLLERGEAERSMVWTDPETGLVCKGRMDFLADPAVLVDLKVTNDLDAHRFSATCLRFGHASQIAMYLRGLKAHGIACPAKIIAVEDAPPYDVAILSVDGDALAAGDEEVGQLLRRVAECVAAGAWPGRYDANAEVELKLPAWIYRDAEDEAGLGLLVQGQEV